MGQSKHNPTAQLAKEGKIPPRIKKPRLTNYQFDLLAMAALLGPAYRGSSRLMKY